MTDHCEHCGSYWDDHDYEHLARTCYPLQVDKLKARIDELLKPPTRTWTSALPTEVGWYWYRNKRQMDRGEARIIHVRDYAGKLAVMNSRLDPDWKDDGGEWCGPIACPLDSPPQE